MGCGSDDVDDLESCDLYTRHIVVPETTYSIIRESREALYPGAVIVVETNVPLVSNIATVAAKFKQTVIRYWYDPIQREVRM